MVLENNSHQDGNFGESEISDPSSNILQFLDSLDDYLTLFDSLSSTLRQGWIELASARHSMGSSRITSVLLDLKPHSAATTIYVDQMEDETLSEETVATLNMVKEPHFTLSKWASISDGKCYSREIEVDEELHKKSGSSQLRRRGPSQSSDVKENNSAIDGGSFSVDDQIQKQRSKSLSVFGGLVSPKLRDAQFSFETALETLVRLANMQSLMASAFAQVRREMDYTEEEPVLPESPVSGILSS